jgi:hypothetical protein
MIARSEEEVRLIYFPYLEQISPKLAVIAILWTPREREKLYKLLALSYFQVHNET